MPPIYLKRLLATFVVLISTITTFAVTASFSANVTSGCAPLTVQFTNTSTGATSYLWDFGNGNTSVQTNTSATYLTSGNYTIRLTAYNGTASSTFSISINVYALPNVNFSATPTTACAHASVSFSDLSVLNAPGAGTYSWNFGNGASGSGVNTSYTYNTPGTYNVNLTVASGAGCVSSLTQTSYITILAPPAGSFSVSAATVCTNNPTVVFINNTTGTGTLSYSWDFGDGTTSTQTNPTHTYGGTGSYTVKLYISSSTGCSDTVTHVNQINVVPGTTASFTGTTSICVGDVATFNNTSTPGITSSSWNFGDGFFGSGVSATHTYNAAGTYHVTLNSTNTPCSDTIGQNITVHPRPSVVFSSTPTQPCPAPATIHFLAPAGATSYSWQFGDGTSSTGQNPYHTYSTNGFYNVKLFATSPFGCVDSLTVPNYEKIYPLGLMITSDVGGGCIPFPVQFTPYAYYSDPFTNTQAAYPYGIATYSWDFGDGTTSTSSLPTHSFTTYGNHTVSLTITTTNGCTISQTKVISAGTPVTPAFTASPLTACVKVPISFSNTTPVNANTTFQWIFGDGNTSTLYSPTHPYGTPFTYDVMLITNNNGCLDTLIKPAYVTINPPNAKFSYTYSCNARNVTFTSASIGATSFLWNFGDGTTDAINTSPVHLYPANGLYHVVLSTHNSVSGCSDSTNANINISSPQSAITVTDTAICRDDTVTLSASLLAAPAGGAKTYSWYLNNTLYPDTTSIFKYAFHTIGQKPVMLIINDYRNCNDTVIKNLLIAHPTVQFTGSPNPICWPDPMVFTDQSTDAPTTSFVTRVWNFGDGTILNGTGATINHVYNAAGSYTVKLYVTDNIGCRDSLVSQSYALVHKPHADFSTSTTACMNRAVNFNNLSTGSNLTYLWFFGDGTSSTLKNPVHFFGQTGTYTIKLVVTDDLGCKDSITRINYINIVANPVAAFTATDTFSVCSPIIDTFTNFSTGAISYAWSFGDGNSSTLFNTKNTYTIPGIYNVRLVVTNTNGCTDTAIVRVNLLGYAGLLTYTPVTGCVPLTVNFTANVHGVPTFTYDFSDGNTFTTSSTTTTHTYTVPGSHVPRLVLTNPRCQAYSRGIDTIKADALIPGFRTKPNPICGSDSVHFTDTSRAYFSSVTSEQWLLASGITSTLQHPVHYYTVGAYPVTLIATSSSGCKDTITQTVHVYPIPQISAGTDTIVCVGDSAQLQPSGGVSYSWAPVALLSCATCTNPYTAPSVATMYYVTGTDINGCVNKDSVLIKLKTKSTGTADAGGDLCLTGTLQLNAHDPYVNATYLWTPAYALNNNKIANPMANPTVSTKYMVVIKEGKCIPDTAFVQINVHPIPQISTIPGQTILAGNSVELQTTETDVTRYSWMPPDGLNCDTCADPTATPRKSTVYVVYGYSEYGCVDSARVKIDVICDHSQVFMPNTFTPNNDGANDRFYPRGRGLQIVRSFRIYDRWGEKIYERTNIDLNDMSSGWDGTFKGNKLTPDVYVYVVDAICETGEPITWTGDITLLR